MPELWHFLHSPVGDAATNMALDEALLRSAAERGRPLLRIYSWARPAVSIGYFQRFPALLSDQYQIVRRPTGGGLVYHGDGVDTTYTVIVPPEHRLYTMSTADAYCAIHGAVAAACELRGRESRSWSSLVAPHKGFAATIPALHKAQVASRRGSYECFQNPVHGDVVVDGRKLAGAAQRRTKWGLLHQGSIATDVTPDILEYGFSNRMGVGFESYKPSVAECTLAEKLVRERYATAAWNRR